MLRLIGFILCTAQIPRAGTEAISITEKNIDSMVKGEDIVDEILLAVMHIAAAADENQQITVLNWVEGTDNDEITVIDAIASQLFERRDGFFLCLVHLEKDSSYSYPALVVGTVTATKGK